MAGVTELKAPIAVWLWIEAWSAWEKKEWHRMTDLMKKALLLQPCEPLYYEMAAWYLAWNIDDPSKKSFYIQQAHSFLEKGIDCNPESSALYEQLGILLRDKLQDPLAASKAFSKAATLPRAHLYLRRFAAYALAECQGHEAEAYEQLKQLYLEGATERVPALLAKMKFLEKKLEKK